MKKLLFTIILLSMFLIAGCTNNTENNFYNQEETNNQNENTQPNINDILKTIVRNHELCNDDSEMFVDIAILGSSEKDNGATEYYLAANGQGFKIDERGNLSNTCGFGIPATIELSEDQNGYNLIRYEVAKDGSLYDSSIKEMFSEEAYKKQKNGDYNFINDKSLLQQAEEYFNVTIIPEPKNNFECTFCSKLRYYNRTPEADEKLNETGNLYFDYTAENNGENTIYFGSDGSFEAKGSRDEGTGTRTFGQDENTIIVLNNNSDHVYTRYIIVNQTEDSLNTILEIIQRR